MSIIKCGCGCGEEFEEKDKYGRSRRFISGHNGRKYDDSTQHKREWNHRNREARYKYKINRIKKIRKELILRAGGKCCECGLKFDGTNGCVLDFHHINPEDKIFNLNANTLGNKKLVDIEIEFDKCILICSNCHRLLHWKDNC